LQLDFDGQPFSKNKMIKEPEIEPDLKEGSSPSLMFTK